jgi:hypothetical protein
MVSVVLRPIEPTLVLKLESGSGHVDASDVSFRESLVESLVESPVESLIVNGD